MNSRELLADADRMLITTAQSTRGRWPRACAWLIRLALEHALDTFWTVIEPGAADCPMRAQLLLLPAYASTALADQTREAWAGLAQAGHIHLFDLAPTAAELRGWHRSVTAIIAGLESAGADRVAPALDGSTSQ